MTRPGRLLRSSFGLSDPRPQPLTLEFYCRACHHSFRRQVQRLYLDVAAAHRHQGQRRTTLFPDEVTIPDPIVCPRCAAVDQFDLAASAYVPLGVALLRARVGPYGPDEPIQFINMPPTPANERQTNRPKRRPPRKKG